MNVHANFRVFDHSIFIFFFHSIPPSFLQYLIFSSLLQNACDKSSHCKNNATCQSGFTLKGYRCLCPPGFEGEHCEKGMSLSHRLKWRIWDFFWFSMQVWQLFCCFCCWKWCEFVSLYKVLNLSIRKSITIVYRACVLLFSPASLYIFVLFCFGLSAYLLFFVCLFVCLFFFHFFYLKWSVPFNGKIRAVHMYVVCLIKELQGELRNNNLIERSHQRTA